MDGRPVDKRLMRTSRRFNLSGPALNFVTIKNIRSDNNVTSNKVNILISGKTVQATEGETIVRALWSAGLGGLVEVGCAGGVCGACTVTVRFSDGRPGGTDLACMRPVEEGMEIFPCPVETQSVPAPQADPTAVKIRAAFPTLDRCTKCGSCTTACPMSIPVMDSVLRMQSGNFEVVAEDFTTCIHCGLCRFVCEDKVKPHSMGMWVRRSLGMSRTESLNEAPQPDFCSEKDAEKEWEWLLADDSEERLCRAKTFRETGRL